jgi:CubicO group peptidase (beta-lactamase class C family)
VIGSALDTLLERYVAEGAVDGMAVAVAGVHGPRSEHYEGKGAPGVPASPDERWPVASMSKLFTTTTVMRLVELGDLTLDEHVTTSIPAFTGDGRDGVRVRDLLAHTSGLPYESAEMGARLAAKRSLQAMLEEAFGEPLLFPPGTGFAYSDYGFLLAGRVAEVATGTPFPELMSDLVLEPMGLRDTFLVPPPSELHRVARIRGVLAEGTDGAMYGSPYALRLGHPAFGVVSSVRDLVTFARHFAPGGPRILSEASVTAMTTSQTGGVPGRHPVPGWERGRTPISWGYGFMIASDGVPPLFPEAASAATFGHPGASGCMLTVCPAGDRIVVVVSNTHLLVDPRAWYPRLLEVTACAWDEAPGAASS